MTGPRRRPPHPVHGGLTIVPPKDWTPAPVPPVAPSSSSRPSSSTVRRRPRNADAVSRQRAELPRADGFAQVPREVMYDRELADIDKVLWYWFADQRELWHGARGPISVQRAAAELARAENTIRAAVARLEARGHITVTLNPGAASTYSLPWLNIHKLGRRMAASGE